MEVTTRPYPEGPPIDARYHRRARADLSRFLDEELVDHADTALAIGFFVEWLDSGRSAPGFCECVGYRHAVPRRADDISNLEVLDMGVYLHLISELRQRSGDLPPAPQSMG